MKNSPLKIMAATVVLLGIPGLALAQIPVTDVAHIAVSEAGHATTAAQLTTMNAQLRADATYLQTGYNGNGLLPLLSSINDKLGKVNATDAQNTSNDNAAARSRLYDQGMIDLKAAATPTQEQFKRACVAITSRMTSAQGHGAARGSSDAIRSSREAEIVLEDRIKAAGTPTQKIADMARERNAAGFCDKRDEENGFPGCSGEGSLPNADVRSSSLTLGATAAASDPTNGSLNASQAVAARAFILNTMAMPPNMPAPDVLEKEGGKRFLVGLNRFAARQSTASTAMNNILASHKAIPSTVNGGAQRSPLLMDWDKRKDDWGKTFGPQVAFPEAPSERDMLRYEVFYYYASPDYVNVAAGLSSDARGIVDGQRETLKQQALTNRILLQMLQRQEDANVMLAQLLNQQMDPLTTASLNSISVSAGK